MVTNATASRSYGCSTLAVVTVLFTSRRKYPSTLNESNMSSKRSVNWNDFTVAPNGWSDSDDDFKENAPPRKKGKGSQRFQVISERKLEELTVIQHPKNTDYSTKWALRNFEEWRKHRSSLYPETPVPCNLLQSGLPEELNTWLSYYVVETRNSKGDPYPPKTIYQLLTGLLRYMRDNNAHTPNFLDKKDTRFKRLHTVLDNHFKQLRKDGVGCEPKHSEVITKEEENLMWMTGILGTEAPRQLLRTVFYLNGKNFCLRGGQEHRDLKLSMLKRYTNPDCYQYIENASKNRQGGLAQLHLDHKCVPIYENQAVPERCHVRILDVYIKKLPPEAKARDIFYARPLPSTPTAPDKPWFAASPIGKNVLANMLKDMCTEAGIKGHKTNHSLRATGASELFAAGVPEKIIQQRTGHRSVEALRVYERTTEKQHQAISNVLGAATSTSYSMSLNQQAGTSGYSFGAKQSCSNMFQNCTVHVYQTPSVQAPQSSMDPTASTPSVQPPQICMDPTASTTSDLLYELNFLDALLPDDLFGESDSPTVYH